MCSLVACVSVEPQVTVESQSGLSGDPVAVRIDNAPPRVLITAERIWGWNQKTVYASSALFAAKDGVTDVSEQAPISGSYSGVSSAGLFWSMKDTGAPSQDGDSSEVIRVSFDFNDDGSIDRTEELVLAKTTGPVEEVTVGTSLPEAFLLKPENVANPPVIIVLGGSEGGDSAARSIGSKFVARGYAVLGLPYYSPSYGNSPQQFPSLPAAFESIPIDKLETARDWLLERDDVDGERIALYGVSKGAEFALEGASRIDGFRAVAAIVPSDVIWEGWGPGTVAGEVSSFSWRGEPLPFVPYKGMAEELAKFGTPGETVRIRTPHDAGREANSDRVTPARILVESIDEPVFLVGGDLDNTWASGPMARNIKATRDKSGLETTLFVSELAGHDLSGDGYSPMSGRVDYLEASEEAKLRLEAWQGLLAFFDRTIGS